MKAPSYDLAFNRTRHQFEGGYANDPDDHGGETYAGISRVYYPHWAGWDIVDELKPEDTFPDNLNDHTELQLLVKEFYRQNFWQIIRGDQLQDQDIANEMFDYSVLRGIKPAVTALQRVINLLNRNQKVYPDLEPDGILGGRTLSGYYSAVRYRSAALVLKFLVIIKGAELIHIAETNTTQEKWIAGWIDKRVNLP